MKLGSPQADIAYDLWHDRQADAYFAPDPVCPWCGCSCDEEGECDECGRPVAETEYFECPYCGEQRIEPFAHCGESDAHNVRYHLTEGCPKCFACSVMDKHHEGNLAAPECDYKECGECGHQWNHS